MNYKESLDYLYQRLPMFQRLGGAALKKDLTNTLALLKVLGNPHKSIKTIHVAGTNGKGSVSHMLAAVFQVHGYKTGLYTSPHLVDFRERIRVNGIPIPENDVVDWVAMMQTEIERIKPSFFEATVVMAFWYLAKSKVDIAIVETGMGGRLDSTNVVNPELSVITNIGEDHKEWLGETFEQRAFEKAGIIKEKTPVVIGEGRRDTQTVFDEKAKEMNAKMVVADQNVSTIPNSDLKGSYQQKNIRTVLTSIQVLQNLGWEFDDSKVKSALGRVAEITGLRGRWEVLNTQPFVVCDTGHNVQAFEYLLSDWNRVKTTKWHFVLGFVQDKNQMEMLNILPKNATIYLCQSSVPRSMDVATLNALAQEYSNVAGCFSTVWEAYQIAWSNCTQEESIFIGGSTFVVADLLANFG